MKYAVLIVALAALGGCASPGATTSIKPVCDALIGPIHYSSRNKASGKYAGPALAPQLAQRNSVGVNLGCPAYK